MVANNSSGVRTLKYGSTLDYVTELRVILPESGLKVFRPITMERALEGDEETKKVAKLLAENKREIGNERPKVTKNSCGYGLERVVHDGILDLPKLFVGAEGTLGIITEASLRTTRKPEARVQVPIDPWIVLGRTGADYIGAEDLRAFGN